MALYTKIVGIVGASFTIGLTGAAASGVLRVANNVSALSARNAAGSGDLSLIGSDGSNNVTVGDANSASILFGPASIGWATGVAAPTITQVAAASGATPQSINLTPQTFNAGSTTAVANTPGSVIVNLAAPGSNTAAGVEPAFQVTRAGVRFLTVQGLVTSPTFPALYLGTATPTVNNFTLLSQGVVSLNSPSGQDIRLAQNGSAHSAINASNLTLFNSTTQITLGGVKTVALANATTVPTVLYSSGTGLVFYSNAGAFELNGAGFQFNNLVQSPAITQVAAASDVVAQSLTISSQAPYTGAVTNIKAGDIIFSIPSPVSGTADGFVRIKVAGNNSFQFSGAPSSLTASTLWMGLITPGAANYVLQSDSNYLSVNAPAAASRLILQCGATGAVQVTTNGVQFFNGPNTQDLGSGVAVMGVHNCTTDPSTNPTGGSIWWSSLTVGASKQRTSSGWTKTTCGNTSTTKNTQLAIGDEIPAFARITTSGSTMVVNVPLATSTSHADLDIRVKIKIAIAGSVNAVGDCFSVRQFGEWKNVGGTVSLVGSLPSAALSASDTSLSTSTVVITTSGTNIVITVTVNASIGTLGTADCTVLVTPVLN